MSLFHGNGFYSRAPDSGVADVDFRKLKTLGFDGLAVNVRDWKWADWSTVVQRASQAGIACLPWARTLIKAEVVTLANLARSLPQRAVIVNAENEFVDGQVPADWIAQQCSGLDAALSTMGWIGTPPQDCAPLGDIVVQLQMWPQTKTGPSMAPRDCRAHAFDGGHAQRVGFMYGIRERDISCDPRDFAPVQAPLWIYTLDDCLGSYEEWAVPEPMPALTETVVPWTGPYYGPSHPKFGSVPKKSKTAKALKLIMHEAGFANFPNPDTAYNVALERAMRRLQRWAGLSPLQGAYGKGSWLAIRSLRSARIGGTYACTLAAAELIREDAA